ncbi:hypothetical protein E7Y31_11535 [Candidatus Frankia alpina]|uniref:Uncharacterized protein n=1 Tax=Candidatus Frankia alpina TaxID=2699483 RepID=A0A4S5EQ73_9ACTN|nr:hypothetical protein E7Y31_11535 [Candidatus Frankia alpina]
MHWRYTGTSGRFQIVRSSREPPSGQVEELPAARGTQPIRSLDDLAADTFDSDEELDEFLAFTYAGCRRDVA